MDLCDRRILSDSPLSLEETPCPDLPVVRTSEGAWAGTSGTDKAEAERGKWREFLQHDVYA
ncbi:unnamed protein product [Citrullus colocynthis]|uniref:Uncharacterized protein n=1 Tax=Citrullus colocynthis TaxID=252529 RepID=A0ABP0YLP3_9ROSI